MNKKEKVKKNNNLYNLENNYYKRKILDKGMTIIMHFCFAKNTFFVM